ncbi:MAG: acetylglutamate kinase [Muribaculaceae bacterium]|nr:acetylglutamate kinase [Muribaculaceae bacterium]
MKDKLTIVKVSGKIVENPDALKTFIKRFTAISGKKLLIHSGADFASKFGNKMGVNTRMIGGRPVVDDNTLQLLTMVYAGLVNKQLVSLLQWHKVNALGITGADMNVMQSVKHVPNNMGWTGDVKQVNAQALSAILDSGVVPVLAPLTHDGKGNLLFNETDAMAAEAAKALALRYDVQLIYCFEKNGVLLNPADPDSVVAVLKRTQYKNLREMEIIKDWFINKLDNAFSAIDHGVKEVIITNAANLGNSELGTHIRPIVRTATEQTTPKRTK